MRSSIAAIFSLSCTYIFELAFWLALVDYHVHYGAECRGVGVSPGALTIGIIISSRIHMIDKQLAMQITRFINIGREPCYDSAIEPRHDSLSPSEGDSHFIWLTDVGQSDEIRASSSSSISGALAIFYYICALKSSCWSGQTLLVTVGGIGVLYVCGYP